MQHTKAWLSGKKAYDFPQKQKAQGGTFVVEGMHEPIIEPERWKLIQ